MASAVQGCDSERMCCSISAARRARCRMASCCTYPPMSVLSLMASFSHLMLADGVKQILVTSSVLARFGVPGQSAYVTSKTGLLGLVRSLAVEWSPQGIMVNALCPGWVDTDMARNSIQSMADAQGMSFEECKRQQESVLPSLRMTTPAEMAQWVDFLFTGLGEGEGVPRLETFTGQALDVNSGSWMG